MPSAKTPGIFSNRCPVCFDGKIFKGIYSMNEKCPNCGNIFEKESGYFIGAMLASYFLAILLIIPTLGLCLFILNLDLSISLFIGLTQLVMMQVLLFRYSRIIWIQIEHRMTKAIH
jgi:uncharacterized protein (DUF983 family)